MLILLLPLAACQTVPRVLVHSICPRLPDLEQTPAAQVHSFTERMDSFLLGNLLAPTDYSLTSPNARLPTAKPGTF